MVTSIYLIIVSKFSGRSCLYCTSYIRLTTPTRQLDYSSRRTTRFATTGPKNHIDPRDKPVCKHAAGHPSLYILSPHNLPSSRTPLVTPHRAPTRHQPRQSTINTRNSLHSRSATRSRGQAEARAWRRCIRSTASRQVALPSRALSWVFAPALPDAEVPVADGGLWGQGRAGLAPAPGPMQ